MPSNYSVNHSLTPVSGHNNNIKANQNFTNQTRKNIILNDGGKQIMINSSLLNTYTPIIEGKGSGIDQA